VTSAPAGRSAGRPLRVLLVEDSGPDAEHIESALRRAGFAPELRRAETAEGLRAALAETPWDIVLSDYVLPDLDGLEALRIVRELEPSPPFVIVTGTLDEETAVLCLKRGADDYVLKENLARLAPAVEQALTVVAERRERQALEHELRHAQKMEAVGQLAGGIAHDFNNLLTVIQGYGEVLRDQLDGDSLECVEQMQQAAERSADLVRQLLAFGRRQVLRPVVLDPNDVVLGLEPMLRRLLPEPIDVELELAETPWTVRADRGQLEQVLVNLVVNARDAMPEGGRLRLGTHDLQLSAAEGRALDLPAGSFVALTVRDDGIGMDAETLARIFDPFFTTKGEGRGTGLGLSTVHGIVKQSGGEIAVESEPGGGSRFRVLLPAAGGPCETTRPETRRSAEEYAGHETVLLVEDERIVRDFMQRILEERGYRLAVAVDGLDGLDLMEHLGDRVDLLLTDLVMPGLGGVPLAQEVQKRWPHVRVLFVSGYAEHRGQPLPEAWSLVEKPFHASELARRVRQTLDDARPGPCDRS